MYTSGLSTSEGLAYSGLKNESATGESAASESSTSRITARRASMYTGSSNTMAGIAREVEAALSGVEPDKNGRITFQRVAEHKKAREEEFANQVKKDLLALGVDEDIEFRLVSNSSGGVSVVSDHEDAAMVERYFKANPEMAEQFSQIEMLGNFDRARQYQSKPVSDMRKEIQMQAVSAFMNTAQGNGMSLVSELMDFSSSGYTAGMFGLSLTI